MVSMIGAVHGSNLPPMAQNGTLRAVFAAELAAGRTVSEAAARAGISMRTAARWHREPEVQAELERMRRSTLSHARERLLDLVDQAVGALSRVMASTESPAATVAAARTVLAHVLRFDERTELEERLRVIEQHIEAHQRWRAPS